METILTGFMLVLVASHFELYRRIGSLNTKVELIWSTLIKTQKEC